MKLIITVIKGKILCPIFEALGMPWECPGLTGHASFGNALGIRVGQFSKVAFLIYIVFHADFKNGLISCLGQTSNLQSEFKVFFKAFFSGFRKFRLEGTFFGQNVIAKSCILIVISCR